MKTYQLLLGLLILMFIGGCSEGGTGESGEPVDAGVPVSYYLTEASGSDIVFNGLQGDKSQTKSVPTFLSGITDLPNTLTHKRANRWLSFGQTDCQATLTLIDFADQTTNQLEIPVGFVDFCEAEIISIAQNSTHIFVAYQQNGSGFIFSISNDLSATQALEKVTLDQVPEQILASEQRVFVKIKEQDELQLLNLNDLDLRSSIQITPDSKKLLETPKDNIIILYDNQHVVLSGTGVEINRTLYQAGSQPNFDLNMPLGFFNDKVAYHRTDGQLGNGPALYDFPSKTVVLFLLTNFMSEQDLDVKYDFSKITAIGMDSDNGLLLIGYQKKEAGKGGLFRISTQGKPKLLDNNDLGFVPKDIWSFPKTE
ncbi:hypothetical protein [Sediminicola luteus]|uniref:Uncharacterized protein n=1 Tax=Sediminicola luteus TaxID=319238 RepID=A0A2A4G6U0_9FLAO|nr:hypothetical protein [Sediminicola luteus]PCE63698.1 hypothetical protein B7P33_10500 [Sediminicola luteus]